MRAVTRLAGQHRESVVSWSLAGATTLALAAALVLLVPNASRIDAGRIGIYAVLAVAVGLYAGTGHLITRRLPGNAIGWLLSLMGLAPAVTMVAEQYALYGLTRASGPVFLARLTGWFSSMLALLTVLLLVFLVMLFPDGRLPSRRWRPLNSPAAASRLELPAATSSRTSSSRWLSAQAQAPDRGPAHGTGSSAGPPPPGREQLAASAPDGGNQKGPRP